MSSPTTLPRQVFDGVGITTEGLWHSSFRSMASPVRVQLGPDTTAPDRLLAGVRRLFAEVDRQCTRFDAGSDLMRANAARTWRAVGEYCFAALVAAHRAHLMTAGRFDPRVLRTLCDLGYDRTWAMVDRSDGGPAADPTPPAKPSRATEWRPRFDAAANRVAVGAVPVDLGGIGKGLALRWAAASLRAAGCGTFLIDAGGDCVYGDGPAGGAWRIGVERPDGAPEPAAVLQVSTGACATSSTRVHSWRSGGRAVHHLIDPRTWRPAESGLRSVTVAGTDPADAEVWSKTLFLTGSSIRAVAEERGLSALWVDADGVIGMSTSMQPLVIWRQP